MLRLKELSGTSSDLPPTKNMATLVFLFLLTRICKEKLKYAALSDVAVHCCLKHMGHVIQWNLSNSDTPWPGTGGVFLLVRCPDFKDCK